VALTGKDAERHVDECLGLAERLGDRFGFSDWFGAEGS
jgi:hypothetical protein